MPNSKNRINEEDITPRNLKDIFKAISDIQQVELDDPSEEKSEEAFKWYEQFAIDSYQQITNSSQFDQRTKKQILTNSTSDFLSRSKRAGVLYTFIYQPETENLDYWDKFPLVLRMLDNSDSTESFLGINLHYLDPKRRWMILMNLMSHLNGPETDPNSRIMVS